MNIYLTNINIYNSNMIASYYLRFKTNSLRSTEHNHKQNKVEGIDVNILRPMLDFLKWL